MMMEIESYVLILAILMCMFGLIGNLLSILVLLRKEYIKSSTSVLLFGLTVFDGFILLTYLIYYCINLTEKYTTNILPTWLVIYVIIPINKTAYTGSIYITVVITMERYYAVCWPLLARTNLTIKRSIASLFVVILFSILINFPRWLENIIYVRTHMGLGYYKQIPLMWNPLYLLIYHGWIWTIFIYIIPFLLIGIPNFKMWREVRAANANRQEMMLSTRQSEGSLTKLLLAVVCVYFILNLCSCSISLGFSIHIKKELYVSFPIVLNSSINFIIYYVMGRHFRSQLIKMCKSWIPFKQNRSIVISRTTSIVYTNASGQPLTRTSTRSSYNRRGSA